MTSARRLLDDCFLHDKDRLRHDEVLALLEERLAPVAAVQQVPLDEAHRLVLAEDVTAPRSIPAHTNAAVDGYAVRAGDLAGGGPLPVSGRTAAGEERLTLKPGTAVRLFTGSEVPSGADAVIMQERVSVGGDGITVNGAVSEGQNIRRRGQDLAQPAQKGIDPENRRDPRQAQIRHRQHNRQSPNNHRRRIDEPRKGRAQGRQRRFGQIALHHEAQRLKRGRGD